MAADANQSPMESLATAPSPPAEEEHAPKAQVGYFQLTFLIYGAACGGAFGLEGMVSQGPGLAIFLIALVPFIYSVPLSLVVSELTAMMPVEGGNYRWSRFAFGNLMGFQAGWWAWLSGVVASASYAALFTEYINTWVPRPTEAAYAWWANHGLACLAPETGSAVLTPLAHWGCCLFLIWLMHYLNVKGIDVVGDSAAIMTFLLLLPFAIMLAIGITHWNANPLVPFIAPGKGWLDLGVALSTVIWVYSGYDKLSAAAEEVRDPQKTFPPALFTAATLAMLSCLLPTVAAVATLNDWAEWTDGFFPAACLKMAGPWLQTWMVVGGLISNALLLSVTMLSSSRVLFAMAADGLMPQALTRRHPVSQTPVASILWGSLLLSALTLFSFKQLLIIYLYLQMYTNLLIYVNAWRLRSSHPTMERPFKLPGGQIGIVALSLPTVVLALAAMICAVFPNQVFDRLQFAYAMVATLSGFVLYPLLARNRASSQASAEGVA